MSISLEDIENYSSDEVTKRLTDQGYNSQNDERLDKAQLILLYQNTGHLTPSDRIYAGSTYFTQLYSMTPADLLRFAEDEHLELPDGSHLDQLRTIIYRIDPTVMLQFMDKPIGCSYVIDDQPIDYITGKPISSDRMVQIPDPTTNSVNCYDIVSIYRWWLEKPYYTDPATGVILPPTMVDQILNNEPAWRNALDRDFNIWVPPTSLNHRKYKEIYHYTRSKLLNEITYRVKDNISLDDLLLQRNISLEIVELLLTYQANPNVINEDGNTPLHSAVTRDQSKIIQLLLDHGADPNIRNNEGTTPLMLATQRLTEPIIELLLNNRADPNITNTDGDGPLIVAIERDQPKIIQLLLNYGAQPNMKNEIGNTPLIIAIRTVNVPIVEYPLMFRRN